MAAAAFIQGRTGGEYLTQPASCLHMHRAGLHICCMGVCFSSELCFKFRKVSQESNPGSRSDTKPQFLCMHCGCIALIASPLLFPEILSICCQGHTCHGTDCHMVCPIGRKLAFPSLVPHTFCVLLRGVYITCQLKFTSSNLRAESKNVNIFRLCFLTLLECLSSYCWKTLEHVEAYKTASVMSIQKILNAEIPEFLLGI